MMKLGPVSLPTLNSYFMLSVCYFTTRLSFDQHMIGVLVLLLRVILHLVYCLQTFCHLVYDQCGYWFCHPGVSKFVCELLYVCNSLKISPYFLLLQNPHVSLHHYLWLNVGSVFLLVLFSPDVGI